MRTRWLGPGLFLATLSTLLLETLDARLLSVLTWYHLSFFAVSLAMFGMAAGAVFVFLHPERFAPALAPAALVRITLLFACAIPLSHLATLVIPFLPLTDVSVMEVLSITVFTIVLAVPFVLSGLVVTLALTRCGGPIGRLYAFDLIGAAMGCVLVVPLLEWSNVSSATLFAGAAAALAALCFSLAAGRPGRLPAAGLALALAAVAVFNTGGHEVLQVLYPKNRLLWLTNSADAITRWNSHSYVTVQRPGETQAFLWGPGRGADQFRERVAWLVIDGEAASPITQWDGNVASLDWVSYDVTTLPYYLRHGDAAVIGVGGGRDILSALWGHSTSVTGIEVNQIMIDLLTGSHRDFAHIATRPDVTLVHDDGRAYMTRTHQHFDVIQNLAGRHLGVDRRRRVLAVRERPVHARGLARVPRPARARGILSVSRWFDPTNVSETSRLLSLGMAALIDHGFTHPRDHLVLAVRDHIATIMLSTAPFTGTDHATLAAAADDKGFGLAVSPWSGPRGTPIVDRIARSTTWAQLRRAYADPLYDYSPPTDARPYYFNMLKPRALWADASIPRGGALGGNLRATLLLLVLLAITTLLVALVIVWPLVQAGRPPMPVGRFTTTMVYFAAIGFAYMLIQIALLQRFAVYLGHPTYTLAIVLFSMLLFTGLGSLLSERVTVGPRGWFRAVPVAAAVALIVTAVTLPGVIARTITLGLPARTAVVLGFAAPLSMLLGMCFPFGVRLVRDRPAVVAWAWGVNGAFGVLASILAVGLSIWVGIDANFWVAGGVYLALGLPLALLARAAPTGD